MPQDPTTPSWQLALTRAWMRRSLLAWLLWPLSQFYRFLLLLRHALYRTGLLQPTRLPVPVIVVGNVLVGGTGKTPVVMALVEQLRQRGIKVGVISRGYGRNTTGCQEVTLDRAAQDVGDEPALIHRRTGVPVYVAEQRVAAATALLAHHPQTQLIISDDGLQHLALARDLEIGVFDDRGVGNGFLLPAGPLREPWPRPLDWVLHTGSHPTFEGYQVQRKLSECAVRGDGQQISLTDLTKPHHAADTANAPAQPLMALAAIAQPEVFFAMLRSRGLILDRTMPLPDHYDFNSNSHIQNQGYTLICTEKDAVKLWPIRPDAWAVPLMSTLPDAFWADLNARIDRLIGATTPSQPLSSRHGHTTT